MLRMGRGVPNAGAQVGRYAGAAPGERDVFEFNPGSVALPGTETGSPGDCVTRKSKPQPEGCSANPVPCSRIEDLYAPSARQTIVRLIGDWLHRQKLTVSEFLHSAAALERFEAAGVTYQHAVQKMAVTLASRSKVPVVTIIKALNELTTSAIQRVYADQRRGLFPETDAEALVELSQTLGSDPAGVYTLTGIVARHLANTGTWDEKLLRLIRLHAHAEKEGERGALLSRITEALVAEIAAELDVLSELFGTEMEFRERLWAIIRLFKGERGGDDDVAVSLRLLARHFADDEFPDARAAMASHILAECRSSKRLCPASLADELKAFRTLVDELTPAQGRYLNGEDLSLAFAERSKRFITQEALVQFIAGAKTPDEKLDRLLTLEENIEGAANKRALTPFAASIISTHNFEEEFAEEFPGMQRIRRLADLQRRVLKSGLQEAQREKMAGALDAAAVRVEGRGRYFAALEARFSDPVERADTYLKFFSVGLFTEGHMACKARRALLGALACPDFASRYTKEKSADRHGALMELVETLRQIGISPEESVRAMTPG